MISNYIISVLFVILIFGLMIAFFRYELKENEKRRLHWIFVHLKTGNRYIVIEGVHLKMKNPTTREWSEAVLYESWTDRRRYVRDKEDFKENFKSLYQLEHDPELEEYKHYLDDESHEKSYFTIFRTNHHHKKSQEI